MRQSEGAQKTPDGSLMRKTDRGTPRFLRDRHLRILRRDPLGSYSWAVLARALQTHRTKSARSAHDLDFFAGESFAAAQAIALLLQRMPGGSVQALQGVELVWSGQFNRAERLHAAASQAVQVLPMREQECSAVREIRKAEKTGNPTETRSAFLLG